MPSPHHPFRLPALIATLSLFLASCGPKPTETNSEANTVKSSQIDFTGRIGIAVRTTSRICLAIPNPSLSANIPITLVNPAAPQNFMPAQISGPSSSPCPVSESVNPEASNYELSVPRGSVETPKLTPLIAYIAAPASANFVVNGNNVEADLSGNHSKNTFRACSANDGIHLSVWNGSPLVGTRLWTGTYYEPGNAGTFPTCDAKELTTSANSTNAQGL